MGYYTDFTLSIESNPAGEEIRPMIVGILTKLDYTYNLSEYLERNIFDFNFSEWRWYNHESDMTEFSKLYPTVTFKLKGVGEEQLPEKIDMWVKYFKNGKMVEYRPELVWPVVNLSELD